MDAHIDPQLEDDRAGYARRLIAHRPELGDAEVARMCAPSQPESDTAPMVLPVEIGERIETVLELIVARLDRIEDRLGGGRTH
jgi:hypothetical protein